MTRNGDSPYIVPVVASLLAIVLWAIGPEASSTLRYERVGVNSLELYRLITAHFVHLDGDHLLINLVGLTLVWWLVGHGPKLWEWVVIAGAAQGAVVIGLYAMSPQVTWYVGLSGMLHGLLVGGAMLRSSREALVTAGLVFVKITWELLAGPDASNLISTKVIYDAHLFGALGGLASAVALRGVRSQQPRVQHARSRIS